MQSGSRLVLRRFSILLCAAALVATPLLGEVLHVPLDAIGAAELLRSSEQGWTPLAVEQIDIELSVTGIMLHGKVTQRFVNRSTELIEALYVFPLPDRAAVYSMVMQIGSRRIASDVRETEEARQSYDAARTSGRKAALLEQQRPNLFTTRVANINPGEAISVELEYYEEVGYLDGGFRLTFPLTYTPRFGRTSGESFPHATIDVRLSPGFPLSRVGSSSHTVEVVERGSHVLVHTGDGGVIADRDFLLDWAPLRGEQPRSALLIEDGIDARYALLMLIPPIPGSEAGLGLPTETLFVIDVSGSMKGPSIRQARQALLAAIDRLRPDDRFNILRFNQESRAFLSEFHPATDDLKQAARDWVGELRAGGGTMIYPALMRGVEMMGQSRSAHAQRILFLTDGAVGNDQELLRAVEERLGSVRLHTIGIGHAPNAYLMRKMARLGHGLCEFIAAVDEADNRIESFFSRLDRPVMHDVELRWEGVQGSELYPAQLHDLHAEEPLWLSARLAPLPTAVRASLGGVTRAGWIDVSSAPSVEAPAGSGIAIRWARARVESLMDSLFEGRDPVAVRDEVVEVALAHNLVTRYTSLVAVDDRPTALGADSILPRGGSTPGPRSLPGLLLSGLGLALAALLLATRQR